MWPHWRTPETGIMKQMARGIFVGAMLGLWLSLNAIPAWAQEKASETPKPAHDAGGDFATLLFVLLLATLIGLGVITRVSRLLHTPLMSLTNAISAIAIVGAILVAGPDYPTAYTVIGSIAIAASMTNIVSGFLITDRMLKMFKQREPNKP
jgi:NAD(P) transhydrogenase subunit alpha